MTSATVPDQVLRFRLAGGLQPLMLVPVSINGTRPREFILDTGAGTTLLTADFARELQVEITGSKQGQTAGGRINVELGRVRSIKLGSECRDNVDVAIADLSHLSAVVGTPIHGDLGYNFLRHFRLTLDFRSCELRLNQPRHVDYVDPTPLAEVPIRLARPSKPLILLDGFANELGPFCFAVETGTSTTAISEELAAQLNLSTTAMPPVTTGSTQIEVRAARLSSLRIGQATGYNVDTIVGGFLDMLSQVVGATLNGVVGYNFLRQYKVVIDYPGETLSLFQA